MKDTVVNQGVIDEVREALKRRVSQISNPGPRNCEKCCFKCEDEDCDDLHIMESALNLIDSLDLFNKKIKDVLQSGCKIVLSLNEIEDNNLGGN